MATGLIIILLLPLLGTVLGSAFVFFMRGQMSPLLERTLLGFASGVMVAASVWSLLIPSIEMSGFTGPMSVMPASVGFLAGIGFLLLIDQLTPHLHIGADTPEGPRSKLSRTAMLASAVTIHNFPEGMAVGVVIASIMQGAEGISTASALAVAIGIAIQNVPEGAIISMPLRAEGNSRWRSFLIGSLSGVVELCAFSFGLSVCKGGESTYMGIHPASFPEKDNHTCAVVQCVVPDSPVSYRMAS